MKKTVKPSTRRKKIKTRESVCDELGMSLSEMYLKLERAKTNHFMQEYSYKLAEEEEYVQECYETILGIGNGKTQKELHTAMSQLFSDYKRIREEAEDKFKIYVRGIGNAGKSTLVNTLLQVEEEEGSKTSKIPETFIIETYSDSIPYGKALVYRVGEAKGSLITREAAKTLQREETEKFLASELICNQKISSLLKEVYDKEERQERIQLIYEALEKTSLRQIVWGMKENAFLKNCILSDTPGLLQELRHTEDWEDVKNYEADGILWVFSQKHIIEENMLEEYKKEIGDFARLNENGCMIAVINVHSEDNKPGDTGWKRMMRQTDERLREHGLLEDFQYICYVNCKKAYEGRMENCAAKIKDSNIEELMGIINTRFLEKRSGDVITDKVRKYHDYMDSLKSNLENSAQEIAKKEEKYEERTRRMKHSLNALESSFSNDLITAKEKHESEMMNRLERKEEELLGFSEWSKKEQENMLKQLAKQDSINEIFYSIYKHHVEKMNQESSRIQEESIVSRYEKIGAGLYFSTHKIYQTPISIVGISAFQEWGVFGDIWEGLIDLGSHLVGFFGGEEAKKRYDYRNKIKPKIKKALLNSISELSYDYKQEMSKAIEVLKVQCEKFRDDSFAEELGEKENTSMRKERLLELSQRENEFIYRERNLKDLLFAGEEKM